MIEKFRVLDGELTEQEHELVVQARAGVDTGWSVRDNDGWVQL